MILHKTSIINLIPLLLHLSHVCGIWPPPYSVNLSHEETFVISEMLKDNDVQDVYDEEELIKQEDTRERLNLKTSENEEFYRIHQQARRYNDRLSKDEGYNKDKVQIFKEFNPDVEEPVPWKAGFVDEKGKFLEDEDTFYFDLEDNFNDNKAKRSNEEANNNTDKVNYDYKNFKAEYENNIKAAVKANDTVKYTTVKEDESVKDSVKAMVDFKKTPRNCTAEEMKGIGLGAVECFWVEMQQPRMKNHMFEKILRVFIIWVILYIVIAIPCWCQYGWCCCCCRCKFCYPRENIAEVQKFFAQNPIGIYHDDEGNVYTYKPTNYEKYAYKKLEKAIGNL
ncbi:hypothetical protein NQ315_003430 [Exocentrus adspersus]|uniref:Uncharacterized protein n=1 Tax=Exocentrus adspersus TaxID=1586481 RepID=A0AAV8VMP0_9CUCU|nr:hypothetical protein NQ315_003430 [Exocentrus adspersus]